MQNIVEGSKAAVTSKEMEIKLTNVARASLEELLEDYSDYFSKKLSSKGEGNSSLSNTCLVSPPSFSI